MTRILNTEILSIRKQELLGRLKEGALFTPNVDHVVRLQKDREFYQAYQTAEWVVCDSVILQRMSHLLRHPVVESIPGSSFFHDFCDYHRHDSDCRIFILGGKEGVAQRAMENVNRRIGRQIVVGAHSPSFSFVRDDAESRSIMEMVKASGATVLMVCATSPKQEVWIARWRGMMEEGRGKTEGDGHVRLFMALGATVDFEAGVVKRCPLAFRRLGLEWFWRFCQEPRRLFHRYFIQDMQFFWYFGKQILGSYRNPFE